MRLACLKNIIFFTLSLIPCSFSQNNVYNINYPLPTASTELFIYYISDANYANQILTHGCWCAKLDPNTDHSELGGPYVADDLDSICKQWAKARHCSTISGASCELKPSNAETYQIEFTNSTNVQLCPDEDLCLTETCQIDAYYMRKILNFNRSGWSAKSCADVVATTVETLVTVVPEEVSLSFNPGSCVQFQTTPMPTELELLCLQSPMDLVFIVDGSGSIPPDDFSKQIEFVKAVVNNMTVSEDQTRIAMVQFSSAPQTEFNFLTDENQLQNQLNNVTQLFGSTNTGAAITYAYDNIIFTGAREGVRIASIVLTDGFSFDDVATPSDAMRANGVYMFAAGWLGANDVQMQAIANDPDEDFIYQGSTIDDLLAITDDLTTQICSQPVN